MSAVAVRARRLGGRIAGPVARPRTRGGERVRDYTVRILTTLAFIALFELISRADTSALPRHLFPPPSSVFGEAYHTVQGLPFRQAFLGTLQGWGYGLLIALALAVPTGIVLGSSKWTWNAARLLVDVLRALPKIALLPLLVLVIGLNLQLKVFIVASTAFWPLLIQVIYGVQDVESVVSEMAKAYRLRYRDRVLRVVLPTLLPYLVTGLKISAVVALNITIAAELLIGGQPGFGTSIFLFQHAGRFETMYVYVLAAATFSLLINIAFRLLERQLLFWHSSARAEEQL